MFTYGVVGRVGIKPLLSFSSQLSPRFLQPHNFADRTRTYAGVTSSRVTSSLCQSCLVNWEYHTNEPQRGTRTRTTRQHDRTTAPIPGSHKRGHLARNSQQKEMPVDSLDEIFALIDECMSDQDQMYEHGGHEDGVGTDIRPSRPPSRGTVFLDWDGTNDPVVSIRDSTIYSESSDAGCRTSRVHGVPSGQSATTYRDEHFRPQETNVRINPKDFRRRPVTSSSPLALTSMLQQQHLRQHLRQDQPKPPQQPPPQTPYSQPQSPSPSPSTRPQRPHTNPILHPQSSRAYKVHGHDPATNFSYSYNGRIVHVHRPALVRSASRASSSAYSEYYAIDARLYDSGKEFRVVHTDKPLPPLPGEDVVKSGKVERENRKRDKVVGFIRRLMRVLDETGRLGKLRRSLTLFGDSKGGKDGEWVERGYVT